MPSFRAWSMLGGAERPQPASLSLKCLHSVPPNENIAGALKNETGRDSEFLVEPEHGSRSAAAKNGRPLGRGMRVLRLHLPQRG
jgi:hypothetical protein